MVVERQNKAERDVEKQMVIRSREKEGERAIERPGRRSIEKIYLEGERVLASQLEA